MPSSPGYKRNYKQEVKTANARGDIPKRDARNKARAELMKEGLVHKGDGKDVDHTKPLGQGGSNSRSNLRVTSESSNRSFRRDSSGGIISQTSRREAGQKPSGQRRSK